MHSDQVRPAVARISKLLVTSYILDWVFIV